MRLAVVASHPVQYYAPLFRVLATRIDLTVFYAHQPTPEQQAAAGFAQPFDWDIDLLGGYVHVFLRNVAQTPATDHFFDCDAPEITAALAGFDAVLVMGWGLKCFWQAILAAKRHGLPALVRGDSHLLTPRSPARRALKALLYPALMRLFDAALYVGKNNRAYYRRYGMPDARLFFSPHCIDAERFRAGATAEARAAMRQSLGVARDEKLVMFVGKLVAGKRPFDILEALARLPAGARPFAMFVGSGPLQAALAARAQALRTPAHSLGFRNQSEMPAIMAAADLLVIPSESETWGLVANEALACGLPILVSDAVGRAPDLAADNRVGRVFPTGDVAALAAAMSAMLAAPADPAAIDRVSDRYSLQGAAEGIVRAVAATTRRRERGARFARSPA